MPPESQRAGIVPWSGAGGIVWAAALAALTAVAAWLRAGGLNPPSLWLDDQWVALIAKSMAWGDYFSLGPPVPVGFVALLKVAAAAGADPERSLQLVPWACSVLAVPAMALLISRVSGLRWTGMLGASLLVVSPACAEYAIRVKQYSGDVLATIVLLFLARPVLERWSLRRGILVAGAGIAAVLFSFPSVFVSVALVHTAALAAIRRRQDRRAAAAVAVAFDLLLLPIFLLLLRGQANEELRLYWQGFFLPTDSAWAALGFLWDRVARGAIAGLLPPGWIRAAAMLAGIGAAALLARGRTRWLGVAIVVVYTELLVASALRLYPLGMPRTDMFSYPLAVLLIVSALAGWDHGPRGRRATAIACGVLAAAGLVALARPSRYLPSEEARRPGVDDWAIRDADLVAILEREIRDEDVLLLYPHAAFAAGYYGPWRARFEAEPGFAHGFAVRLERERCLTLPVFGDVSRMLLAWEGPLRGLLAANAPRVFFFVSNAHPDAVEYVARVLERAGHVMVRLEPGGDAALIVYQRPPP